MTTRPLGRLVVSAAIIAAVGLPIVYLTRSIIDWPATLAATSSLAQIIALIVGGVWAYVRFGLTRAKATFLEMTLEILATGRLSGRRWLIRRPRPSA